MMNTGDRPRRTSHSYLYTVLERIKTLREDKNFSQEFMAQALSLTADDYFLLELGMKRLTLDLVLEICALLNADPEEVLK